MNIDFLCLVHLLDTLSNFDGTAYYNVHTFPVFQQGKKAHVYCANGGTQTTTQGEKINCFLMLF